MKSIIENYDKEDAIRTENIDLATFLKSVNYEEKLIEIESNTTSKSSFTKRFYQWFDAFLLMKYLHFMRENGYPDTDLQECVSFLFNTLKLEFSYDPVINLNKLRELDKNYKS